jgi:hypothetical protein
MSDGGLTPEDVERTIKDQTSQGVEVVQSASNLLLLDLDNIDSYERYKAVRSKVFEYWEPRKIEEWESKSGNRHVKITLGSELPPETRCALQAAMGSDGIREVLGLVRLMAGCKEPFLLFKPKQEI